MIKPSIIAPKLPSVPQALREFMESYFSDGRISLKAPQRNILAVEGITCFVLYRDAPYQVELVIIGANVSIPDHCHDDIESFEVFVSGSLEFYVDGVQTGFMRQPRNDGMSRDFCKYVPIASDAVHGGCAGPEGASFLSVQRWREGVAPSHVLLNWRGDAMGKGHAAVIEALA